METIICCSVSNSVILRPWSLVFFFLTCPWTWTMQLHQLPPSAILPSFPHWPYLPFPFTSVKHRGADNPPLALCSAGGQTWASHRLQAQSPRIHFFSLTLKINLFSVESRSGFLTDPAIIPTWGKLSILSALCIATCKKDKCFFFLPHYGGTFWGKLGFDSANFGSYCGIDIVFWVWQRFEGKVSSPNLLADIHLHLEILISRKF